MAGVKSEVYTGPDKDAFYIDQKDARDVTLIGGIVNFFLSIVKLVAGLLGNSAALVADAVHSISDLFSDVIIWFAFILGSKEPDEDHPYGHRRIETFGMLFVSLLIAFTAIMLGWNAVERMEAGEYSQPGVLALSAVIASVLVKELLFRYTLVVARRIDNPLLEGNAHHHRSDALSSIAALIGVAGSMVGLPMMDLLAALVVAVMLLTVSFKIGMGAISEMSDAAVDEKTKEKLISLIHDEPDAIDFHLLKTRRIAGQALVEVHVQVPPRLSVSCGHQVAEKIRRAMIEEVAEVAEVLVHIDPEDDIDGIPLFPHRDELLSDAEEILSWFTEIKSHRPIAIHLLTDGLELKIAVTTQEDVERDRYSHLSKGISQALIEKSVWNSVEVFFEEKFTND